MSRTRSFLDSAINYEYDDSPLVKKLKGFHTPKQSDGCRQTRAGGGDEPGRRLRLQVMAGYICKHTIARN